MVFIRTLIVALALVKGVAAFSFQPPKAPSALRASAAGATEEVSALPRAGEMERFAIATTAAAILWAGVAVGPAHAAAGGDALGVDIKKLSLPQKELTIDINPVQPIFSGGRVTASFSLDTKKQKTPADIVISLPKDLKKAADGALAGHASATLSSPEISIGPLPVLGKVKLPAVAPTRLDLDLATTAGRAVIEVKSPAIPELPFPGKKSSPWNAVTNLGDGKVYYYNTKTGATQTDAPF